MDLYQLLDVPRDASTETIARTYRRLALAAHPDRCQEAGAADRFKALTAAYEVLKDEDRRGLYDTTGVTGDGDGTSEARPHLDPNTVGHDISAFYNSYRGSPEEQKDIMDSYNATGGSFRKMMLQKLLYENIPGETERLKGVVESLLKRSMLKKTSTWESSSQPEQLTLIKKRLSKERKQATAFLDSLRREQQEKQQRHHSSSSNDKENTTTAAAGNKRSRSHSESSTGSGCAASSGGGSLADLQALMLSRKQQEKTAFEQQMNSMEEKYCGGSTSGSGKKRQTSHK